LRRPALHSFPTRRSSDLRSDVLEVLGKDVKRRLQLRGIAGEKAPTLEGHEQPLVRVEHYGVGTFDAAQQIASAGGKRHKRSIRRDRKSTRLNSSHDQISY